MEYIKTVIVGVGFKDFHQNPMSQHFFAEVVLIDKSQEALNPLLYQLNKSQLNQEPLENLPRDFASMQKDAFMMIGEVAEIDKKKKMIYLSNNNTVSYTHLIVAKDNKNYRDTLQDKEFVDGLQTLIDALRIKKIPMEFTELQTACFNPQAAKALKFSHFDPANPSSHAQHIQNIVNHRMLKQAGSSFTLSLNGIDKCLYEVVV